MPYTPRFLVDLRGRVVCIYARSLAHSLSMTGSPNNFAIFHAFSFGYVRNAMSVARAYVNAS